MTTLAVSADHLEATREDHAEGSGRWDRSVAQATNWNIFMSGAVRTQAAVISVPKTMQIWYEIAVSALEQLMLIMLTPTKAKIGLQLPLPTHNMAKKTSLLFTGVHSNQDQIWCAKIG